MRIWIRVWFWTVLLLVAVVGLGIRAHVIWRRPIGPPPTLPGDSREFDKHLAEIDEDWLFLFDYDGKLVATDIYGHDQKVLLNLKKVLGRHAWGGPDDYAAFNWIRESPGGRYSAVSFRSPSCGGAETIGEWLGILDMKSLEMPGTVPNDDSGWILVDDCWWLDEDTLFAPYSCMTCAPSNRQSKMFAAFRVDADNVDEQETVVLPRSDEWPSKAPWPAYDEETRCVMFHPSEESGYPQKLHAYDKDGLREAAADEAERYEAIIERRQAGDETTREEARTIPVEERTISERASRLLPERYRRDIRVHEIILNGEVVRTSKWDIRGVHWESEPTWDETLNLFLWKEEIICATYYMDEEGHYRLWHRGKYWCRIPRWED